MRRRCRAGPAQWPRSRATTNTGACRRTAASSNTRNEVLVAATTELGAGYWVLTPLQTADGAWLLVNRGFVPPELRGKGAAPPGEEQTVTGLLRLTEPGGLPAAEERPGRGRWYSRDVAAIAAAQHPDGRGALLRRPSRHARRRAGWPRAGLTVLRFRNDHLVYALTWFALAAIMAAAPSATCCWTSAGAPRRRAASHPLPKRPPT
jgi:surfeit locus 1 family protein